MKKHAASKISTPYVSKTIIIKTMGRLYKQFSEYMDMENKEMIKLNKDKSFHWFFCLFVFLLLKLKSLQTNI